MPSPSSSNATDVFSLSDQTLAERLQFVKEIGFGNWGSVWLCKPKSDDDSVEHANLAVKLVHRSKTSTTAARVRSLWNEMKIVRTFKNDPHPSIVPFHSFIITPSYALITMDYLPDLVPVEVPELKAKRWFHSLLSAVAFLHKRGVVHNDIKPANILLSADRVPVLVDFGFAEKYDTKGSQAFHSNLTYGTPEYLSPERARGLPHDTRKSDVWSLGITFFEILVGRTPFESPEGEQFTSKDDLEKYYQRTLRGKWVGTWKMSMSMEQLIQRMTQPNADVRCLAADALADQYWADDRSSLSASHRRIPSTPSLVPDRSKSRAGSTSTLLEIISPWATRRLSRDVLSPKATPRTSPAMSRLTSKASLNKLASKDNKTPSKAKLVPKDSASKLVKKRSSMQLAQIAAKAEKENDTPAPKLQPKKSDILKPALPPAVVESPPRAASRPKLQAPEPPASILGRTRVLLAPIAGSPPTTPVSARRGKENKENAAVSKENTASKRNSAVIGRSYAARKPVPSVFAPKNTDVAQERRPGPFTDATGRAVNAPRHVKTDSEPENGSREQSSRTGSVRDRMRDWERERERLRNLELESSPKKKPTTDAAAAAACKDDDKPEDEVKKASEPEDSPIEIPPPHTSGSERGGGVGSVRDRMREWERERLRLRQLERSSEDVDAVVDQAPATSAEEPDAKAVSQLPVAETSVEAVQADDGNLVDRRRQQAEATEPVLESGAIDRVAAVRPPGLTNIRGMLRYNAAHVDDMPSNAPSAPEMSVVSSPEGGRQVTAPESSLGVLRQSLKASVDRLQKASITLGFGRRTSASNHGLTDLNIDDKEVASLDAEISREAKSSLPAVHQAIRNDIAGAESHADRMSIWLRNVERVVKDAHETFEACNITELPPLPLAPTRPGSRNGTLSVRSRQPRKILAASEIFSNRVPTSPNSGKPTTATTNTNTTAPVRSTSPTSPPTFRSILPIIPAEDDSGSGPSSTETPRRKRRATLVGVSPHKTQDDTVDLSPSRRKEKSRSQNDLQRMISPVSRLTREIERLSEQQDTGPQRLSALVDKDVFSLPTLNKDDTSNEPPTSPTGRTSRPALSPKDLNDLRTPSPSDEKHSYERNVTSPTPSMRSPMQKNFEGVYERLLMSTAGVRRRGLGFESDRPLSPSAELSNSMSSPASPIARVRLPFNASARRRQPMHPPVSSADTFARRSEDALRTGTGPTLSSSTRSGSKLLKASAALKENRNRSFDELGVMRSTGTLDVMKTTPAPGATTTTQGKGTTTTTVRSVRQAFRAIVTGKNTNKQRPVKAI